MQWLNISRNYGGAWLRKSARLTCNKTRLVLLIGLLSVISFFLSCRMELNIRVYIRSWLSPPQDIVIEPLSSCFDKVSDSSVYYQGSGKFRPDVVPGLPVWESHTCYDFAALLKPKKSDSNGLYHTYWSSNMTDFGDKQLATLRSFSATQNANHSLIVWIPEMDQAALTKSSAWTNLKKQTEGGKRNRITYQVIEPKQLTQDTPLESHTDKWRQLVSEDNDRQGRDDLLRMLVLYQHGGIWFDLNTLFVRDLSPLREHEWMAQGNCASGTLGNPFTGALFHFTKHSPYVCEMLEGAADLFKARADPDKAAKRHLVKGPEIFGSKLYYRIYRRITHHGIRPWSGLPWCFTDPSQCKRSNSLPSLFSNSIFDEKRVNQVFAYHWREKWTAGPGKLFEYIDGANRKRTNW